MNICLVITFAAVHSIFSNSFDALSGSKPLSEFPSQILPTTEKEWTPWKKLIVKEFAPSSVMCNQSSWKVAGEGLSNCFDECGIEAVG